MIHEDDLKLKLIQEQILEFIKAIEENKNDQSFCATAIIHIQSILAHNEVNACDIIIDDKDGKTLLHYAVANAFWEDFITNYFAVDANQPNLYIEDKNGISVIKCAEAANQSIIFNFLSLIDALMQQKNLFKKLSGVVRKITKDNKKPIKKPSPGLAEIVEATQLIIRNILNGTGTDTDKIQLIFQILSNESKEQRNLIEREITVDDNQEITLLEYAASHGWDEFLIKFLFEEYFYNHSQVLKFKIHETYFYQDKELLLGCAIREQQHQTEKLLSAFFATVENKVPDKNLPLSQYKIEPKDIIIDIKKGTTLVHHAAFNGWDNFISEMNMENLSVTNKKGLLPIDYAASAGRLDTVKLLVDLDEKFKQTKNILSKLTWKSISVRPKTLYSAAQNGHKEVVAFLLTKGSHINGWGALYYAVEYNRTEVAELLLDKISKFQHERANPRAILYSTIMANNYDLTAKITARKDCIDTVPLKFDCADLLEAIRKKQLFSINLILSYFTYFFPESKYSVTLPIQRLIYTGQCLPLNLEFANITAFEDILYYQDSNGEKSLLHHAIDTQDWSIIQMLIEAGFSVNKLLNFNMLTPLEYAFFINSSQLIIEKLFPYSQDKGIMFLYCAKYNRQIVSQLNDLNPQKVIEISTGMTPLHYAAKNNNSINIFLLMREGFDINVLDNNKMSPFDYAAGFASEEVLQSMLSQSPQVSKKTVLAAQANGLLSQDTIKKIIDLYELKLRFVRDDILSLIKNGKFNDSKEVNDIYLLMKSQGIDVDDIIIDENEKITLPQYAVIHGNELFLEYYCFKSNTATLCSLYYIAIMNNNAKTTKLLHEVISARGSVGATQVASIKFTIGDLLTGIQKKYGFTVKHIIDCYLIFETATKLKVLLNAVFKGKLFLYHAIETNDFYIVKCLIEAGADVDVSDGQMSALEYACFKQCNQEIISYMLLQSKNPNKFILLVKYLPDQFDEESMGMSPLHYAAQCGNSEIVKDLLEKGYRVNKIDSFGMSPLSYAAQDGDDNLLSLLLARNPIILDIDYNYADKNSKLSKEMIEKLREMYYQQPIKSWKAKNSEIMPTTMFFESSKDFTDSRGIKESYGPQSTEEFQL